MSDRMSDNIQGAGAGIDPQDLQQSQSQNVGGGYDSLRQSQDETQNDMGGGNGTHGSGVAGGYEGNSQNQTQTQTQSGTQEKQDWLDKGISSVGQKFGININQSNADKAGDFLNKEAKERLGRNLPGVN